MNFWHIGDMFSIIFINGSVSSVKIGSSRVQQTGFGIVPLRDNILQLIISSTLLHCSH